MKPLLLLPEASDLWLSPAHKARQAAARVLAGPGTGYIRALASLWWLRRQTHADARAVDDLAASMAVRLTTQVPLSTEVVKQLLLECTDPLPARVRRLLEP